MLLDGYVRVSRVGGREGESFISPLEQRREIEAWISAHGATLGEVFEELDESGAREDRPLLAEAIERVESGTSGGIVVAKLDRFGRSLAAGLRAIRRIDEAGGRFVSVRDGLELTTETGRLVLQVLFSIGEWELERVRENWDVAKVRAIARGVYLGPAPIGYRRGADGRLQIDPEGGPMVREIFERRASGESLPRISRRLNKRGLCTKTGAAFTDAAVLRILRNPAYTGEARHGEDRNPGAHPPIVDAALWQSAQKRFPRPKTRPESLLAGMIRCASCGQMMRTRRASNRQGGFTLTYRCPSKLSACKARAYARADQLDPLVEEFIFTRCGNGRASKPRRSKHEAAVAEAEAELTACRENPALLRTLGPARFAEELGARRRELESRVLELAAAPEESRAAAIDVAALEASWSRLGVAERREAARGLLDCVFLAAGPAPVIERASVYRHGRAPLRREGRHLVGSFDATSNDGERLSPVRGLEEAQLEHELRGFLAGRSEWPAYPEFARAGRGRLYHQVLRCGGPHHWGRKLGVTVPEHRPRWTPETLEGALTPFLRDRQHWPTKEEFEAAELGGLYTALVKERGLAHWAAHFGLTYRAGYRYQWPSERIELELSQTATDGEFPTRRQLRAAGLSSLYEAIRLNGGVIAWAARLKLHLAPDRRARLEAQSRRAAH
jgi:DNA invertase Pin-like site-specific DNA recombinase